MSKTSILVGVGAADPIADIFRNALGKDQEPDLSSRIDLQFAAGDAASEIISEVEIAVGGGLSPDLMARAGRLKWIAYWSAGMDGKVTPQLRERNLLLTNASGVHGPNISEHVMAFMLMFTRRMDVHLRSQIQGVWERGMPDNRAPTAELCGQTLGIVGLGRIGEALAIRAKAFGMRIVAVKRDITSHYDSADAARPDALYTMQGLPQLLGESDHVCIALPYTRETRHLFNAETIACMKPTAYLHNIARGAIINERALVTALRDGVIAGAGLDVFEEEPLPQSSELWSSTSRM